MTAVQRAHDVFAFTSVCLHVIVTHQLIISYRTRL